MILSIDFKQKWFISFSRHWWRLICKAFLSPVVSVINKFVGYRLLVLYRNFMMPLLMVKMFSRRFFRCTIVSLFAQILFKNSPTWTNFTCVNWRSDTSLLLGVVHAQTKWPVNFDTAYSHSVLANRNTWTVSKWCQMFAENVGVRMHGPSSVDYWTWHNANGKCVHVSPCVIDLQAHQHLHLLRHLSPDLNWNVISWHHR